LSKGALIGNLTIHYPLRPIVCSSNCVAPPVVMDHPLRERRNHDGAYAATGED
jgi:hypothetical protein